MRAFRTTRTPPYLELVEVADPTPQEDRAVVRVSASSLNRGEVLDLPDKPTGSPVGWDLAGVVAQAAADGSGPSEGTRVVGILRSGAWAELASVRTTMLAALPDEISDAQAAAAPTAALTALRSLEVAGLVLAKRVLITGATGGVGRYAVQLARAGGAQVSALVRDADAARDLMRRLGADVVTTVDGQYDVIVDGVGGETFGRCIEHLAPRGVLVNIATDLEHEMVGFRATSFDRAPGARIYTFNLTDELAAHGGATPDLRRVIALLLDGRLDPHVEAEFSWRDTTAAIQDLLERRVGGKVVLRID